MNNGIILIDKPAGMTSFGVVARIRRVLTEKSLLGGGKKVKVGHTGTLDPFATGLMILVIGSECKNAGIYTKLDKIYDVTIHLGQTSSTGDSEGEISDISDRQSSETEIKKVFQEFIGEIFQRPPIYSAIKINGQRAYDLARSGKQVEMPMRQVTIYSLDLISYSYPEIKIRVHVSSGTYIRSLATDIGESLGIGAYCSQLRRIEIGKWRINQAQKLADFGIES